MAVVVVAGVKSFDLTSPVGTAVVLMVIEDRLTFGHDFSTCSINILHADSTISVLFLFAELDSVALLLLLSSLLRSLRLKVFSISVSFFVLSNFIKKKMKLKFFFIKFFFFSKQIISYDAKKKTIKIFLLNVNKQTYYFNIVCVGC